MKKTTAKAAVKRGGMEIEQSAANVLSVRFPYVHEGWEQWILLTSDRHHDSKHANREFELEHLVKARARNARIVDVGDIFDAMQGKYDPRRMYSDLRPEYLHDDYLDVIVKDAAKFYAPYADLFLVMGRGNHEMAVLKNTNVDLISNLVHRLNSEHGGRVQAGGYGGWVRFIFKINGTQSLSKNLKYFHGAGGGGPVTRGVIQTNRQAVYLPDADIVVNGHTHDAWYVPIQRERLSEQGVVTQDIQHHVRTTSYKDEYADGAKGWHVETWKPPKPVGAAWLRFFMAGDAHRRRGSTIHVEVMQDLKQ
jgi:hypothetical protein